MEIPFYDLKSVNAPYMESFIYGSNLIFESGHTLNGPHLTNFEKSFSNYQGAKYCVGVANGLDAITLTLRAMGIGPGDEVLVPAFTFIATWFAVTLVGAVPIAVDVDESALLDVRKISDSITSKTKAMITVNLFGQMSDVLELRKVCDEKGIFLIEDAAQSHGARIEGVRAGEISDAAAFSFYPTKNLGALGDAGAVLTNDLYLAEKIREIANYGSRVKYSHEALGVNSRMDEVQAFFLGKKLSNLDNDNKQRQFIADQYRNSCKTSGIDFIEQKNGSVYHLFVVQPKNRKTFQTYMDSKRINTLVHYPHTPLESPVYSKSYNLEKYQTAKRLSKQVVSLPLWPCMSQDELNYICENLIKYENIE